MNKDKALAGRVSALENYLVVTLLALGELRGDLSIAKQIVTLSQLKT